MDPLTHTLVGATLADTGLRGRSRLAGVALVVGANLPDVDVLSYVRGSDFALGFRRGMTHGVPALLLLPLLLGAVLWLRGRWTAPRAGDGRPLSLPWLVSLSALAVWTHPALDWLNTYGMRWGMPWSGTWSYGDSVFIVEPWLWGVLGGAWLLRRRPRWGLVAGYGAVAAGLFVFVGRRAPGYLPLLAVVLAALAVCLIWRPGFSRRRPGTWSRAALGVGLGIVVVLIGLHAVTVRRVMAALPAAGLPAARVALVGPRPADPLTWDVVVRDADDYRWGTWRWGSAPPLTLGTERLAAADAHPLWPVLEASGQQTGFLAWTRLPWIEVERQGDRTVAWVMDARYVRSRASGFGAARFELDRPPAP